jgi:hypothetical protein
MLGPDKVSEGLPSGSECWRGVEGVQRRQEESDDDENERVGWDMRFSSPFGVGHGKESFGVVFP